MEKYMVFVKPGCVLRAEVDLSKSNFNANDYNKPSTKLLIAELKAANKNSAVTRVSNATGLNKDSLMATEVIELALNL